MSGDISNQAEPVRPPNLVAGGAATPDEAMVGLDDGPGGDTSMECVTERARGAWASLRAGGKDWGDWLSIGRYLAAARRQTMHDLGRSTPGGRPYSEKMHACLVEAELEDLEKATRTRLLHCIDKLPQVEEWRCSLSAEERTRLNHPTTVWNRYCSSRAPKSKRKPNAKDARIAELEETVVELRAELDRYRREADGWVAPAQPSDPGSSPEPPEPDETVDERVRVLTVERDAWRAKYEALLASIEAEQSAGAQPDVHDVVAGGSAQDETEGQDQAQSDSFDEAAGAEPPPGSDAWFRAEPPPWQQELARRDFFQSRVDWLMETEGMRTQRPVAHALNRRGVPTRLGAGAWGPSSAAPFVKDWKERHPDA